MTEQEAAETGFRRGKEILFAPAVLLFLVFFQVVYFAIAFRLERLFIFEDDFIRLTYARFAFPHLFTIHPWGEWGWLPATTFLQGIAAAVLPFGLVANVLLPNLALTIGSIFLIDRLALRISPGPERLAGPALFALSPITAWLATSALSEPATIFLLLLQCYLLVRFLEQARTIYYVGATIAAALAMLIRFESWFVCPVLLAMGVALAWREGGMRVARTPLLVGLAALAAPLSWMTGQWIRFGDPLHTLHTMAGMHEPLNLRLSGLEVFQTMMEALAHIALPAWILLVLAGFLALLELVRGSISTAWQRPSPAVLFPLLAFLLLFAIFLYSVLTYRWGFPLHRFILAWLAPAFPLMCYPLVRVGKQHAQKYILLLLALSLPWFFHIDRDRPDIYAEHGLLAWKQVEDAAQAGEQEPTADVVIPEGQAEFAAASATAFAPSVTYTVVPVSDGNYLAAIEESDTGFVVIRRPLLPASEDLLRHQLLYADEYYAVLVPREQEAP